MKKSTICKSKKADFLSFMQNQIQEKKMRNKIKTSANYQSSLRSFTHFLQTNFFEALSVLFQTWFLLLFIFEIAFEVSDIFQFLRNTRRAVFFNRSSSDMQLLYGQFFDVGEDG